ncbi:MAG: extracellular solute-binding protein [Melioribacter sp.]|nr:extracellular solute-binding protein [Melioribacter sp.]
MISVKQKWGFVLLLVLVLVYVIIFYFQKSQSHNSIVEIYFADRITAAHRFLIDEYNKMMKGKVKVVPIDFPHFDFSTNERKEVLARSLRGRGDGIDIFAVDIIWVQRFAKWSEPLDKYFSQEEKERILPLALESCYSNGELVAVPLNRVQGVLYYREDILKKFKDGDKIIERIKNGITWEEFIELKNKINTKNPFYIFPAADYEGFICSFMELLLSQKPDYFYQYGFNFDKPEAEKALQTLVDFIHKYKITPKEVIKFTEIPSYAYFVKNDGLFIHGWPSYDRDFKESPFDSTKEKYLKKAPLPYFKNGTQVSILGGWNLMVSKFSDKKEEAINFIKFLLSDHAQETFYKLSGHYPIVKKFYYDTAFVKKYPDFQQIRMLIKTAIHRPAHQEYTRYSKIMSYYFEQAISGKISVKEALMNATNSIQYEKNIIKEF